MIKLTRRFIVAAYAAFLSAAAVGSAPPAAAQSPLGAGPPYPGGVCTCSQMTPPSLDQLRELGVIRRLDCASAMREMRESAGGQKAEMRKMCGAQSMQRCEQANGPDACASMAIDIATNCAKAVEEVYERDFVPVLNERKAQCEQANRDAIKQAQAPWIEWCETVERPSACSTCNDMTADIAKLEAEIAAHEAEIAALRAKPVFSDADQATINQRLSDVQFLENQLKNKKQNYAMFAESGYCS